MRIEQLLSDGNYLVCEITGTVKIRLVKADGKQAAAPDPANQEDDEDATRATGNATTSLDHLPDVLTAQHIADYLQVNVRRIYDQFQLNEAGGGIPHYTVGKQKRVDKADFIKWKESNKQAKADRAY